MTPPRRKGPCASHRVKHIVDALRTLFRGHVIDGTVGVGALIGVALIVAGMAFGTRTFQREAA